MINNDLIIRISPLYLACAIAVVILLFPLLKRIAWWMFKFDRNVSKLINQKKSSEVRTGQIIESVAPILENFPVDVSKQNSTTLFMGNPIDFIHYDPDEGITFIEVKSGNSKLSSVQRKLKEHVEKGNVFWKDFRVK